MPQLKHFTFTIVSQKKTQWDNPRIPNSTTSPAAGLGTHDRIDTTVINSSTRKKGPAGGYNPAIHGDYDPNADYALEQADSDEEDAATTTTEGPSGAEYAASGAFNRFTGRWQNAALTPENFNDENKSGRQMNAFFDVESAANNHDGRSLKAERQTKKFSRKEIKAFKEKRREKKEEKRRAWLRD